MSSGFGGLETYQLSKYINVKCILNNQTSKECGINVKSIYVQKTFRAIFFISFDDLNVLMGIQQKIG